ncbi:MAG: type II toxin-antitoxin system RelE/ParE family toxin [Elusimicrobium sp.]|jgi:putative addiction module killer protein|nr:type II toxin-antitoxin system RelE/ParE family toxin [Elusimicrobium sp.]
MKEIVYFTINGKRPFDIWFAELDYATRDRVMNSMDRLAQGSFGDCKYLGEGLVEMRLFFAGGIRIYFTEKGSQIIIILTAGNKKTQNRDIAKAKEYLKLI